MASPNTGGYDQDFLAPPAKLKQFECPLCLLVTREPNQTSCCGHVCCQTCINRVLQDRQPCPLCKQDNFSVFLDKKQRRQVRELKVRCSVKALGCDWIGELGELATHTDTQKGKCQFVNVTCPNSCGESQQRCHMDNHLSNTCRKRPYTCQYCKLKSTYERVCKHYGTCPKYPLDCPNKCNTASMERERMDKHLSTCPLQVVECEYAYAGCSVKIKRKDIATHMEQYVQKHLLGAFSAQIATLEEKMEKKLKEKDQQIELLRTKLATLEMYTPRPVEFTVPNCSECKLEGSQVKGPVLYIQPSLAKIQIAAKYYEYYTDILDPLLDDVMCIKYLCLDVFQMPGEYDEDIVWPVKCSVKAQLLNQAGNEGHISGTQTFSLTRSGTMGWRGFCGYSDDHVLQVDCEAIENCSKRNIQYVKDDSVKFRIFVETLH